MQQVQPIKEIALAPLVSIVKHLLHKMAMVLAIFCSLITLPDGEARAAIINVGGACSLPDAVLSANLNIAIGGCSSGSSSSDTLVLQSGSVHNLTAPQSSLFGGSGLLVFSSIVIEGNGATIRRAGGAAEFRIIHIRATAALTLKDTTISGGIGREGVDEGEIGVGGGGILNRGTLVTNNSTVSGNSSSLGGGIYNDNFTWLIETTVSGNTSEWGGGIVNTGTLIVQKSSISLNSGVFAGGIYNAKILNIIDSNISRNNAEFGGGLYSAASGAPSLPAAVANISRSTFSGNTAREGGAIGIFDPSSRSNINNTTISGNTASETGGGIINLAGSPTILNSTIVNNRAPVGAGVYQVGSPAIKLGNTIVANSLQGRNCAVESGSSAVGGLGVNWISDASCFGVANSGNINLGPLQDNGGPTFTHALLKGSAAIDAANPVICAGSAVNNLDQRRKRRPFGARCDIGAFEFSLPIMAPILFLLLDD